MADSVVTDSTLITYTVLVEGKEVPGHFPCMAVSVSRSINKIAHARLEYFDGGSTESTDFSLSNEGLLDPGKKIEIKAGYDSKEEVIFKGIIIKHSLKINHNSPLIVIDCKDEAIKLTAGRKNAVFQDAKDSDIISEVVKGGGLSVDVDSTSTTHSQIIQHHATNWDFILMRAEMNGLFVNTNDGKLEVKKPAPKKVLSVGYGSGFIGFNGEIDSRNQYKSVAGASWDLSEQKLVDAKGSATTEMKLGDLTPDKLAEVLGLDEYLLQSPSTMSEAVLKEWASSRLTRSRLAKVNGTLKIQGNAKVMPGTSIEIEGLSNHFNGEAFVGAVEHVLEDGDWITEVSLGLNNETYAEETPYIESPAAGGTLPSVNGLQIGIVQKIDEDPEGNYRVQVKIPTLQQDNKHIWARLSHLYATNAAGFFFFPEINDEVLVGFLNDDPLSPVIIGSLYSKKLKPKFTPDEKNTIKSITTKGELEINFEDEKKILTISTPGGSKIIMDDDEKNIIIQDDANKNKITMSSDGIALEAQKDIVLKADGDVSIESNGKTNIKATQDVAAEGMNVSLKGNTKFSAEGAQAEVKGSGMTTIKGGMVQIN